MAVNVDVLGIVAVRCGGVAVSGRALGGRRARVALVALALSGAHVPADRLAAAIWGDALPPTWPAALRGVVRGLRSACARAGVDGQRLIVTTPSGYRLADGVAVDVERAADDVRRAAILLREGRLQAVVDLAGPVASTRAPRPSRCTSPCSANRPGAASPGFPRRRPRSSAGSPTWPGWPAPSPGRGWSP